LYIQHFAAGNPGYPFSDAAVKDFPHTFLGPDTQLVGYKPAPFAVAAMAPSTYSGAQGFAKAWDNIH
jgi:hypothetical protein